MSVSTFTKSGTKATAPAKLDKKVFGEEVRNHNLLKEAYLAYLANGRINSAKTKKRGEVSGGGRKPWRQKGTGNARFGSTRNPIWKGGGVAFGPTGEENYVRAMNTASKRKALRQALSLAAAEDKIMIIETFAASEGRVKPTIALLKKVGAKGSILLAISEKGLMDEQATRNIPNLKLVHAKYLNVFDVMNADTILLSRKALEIVHEWLGDTK